MYVKKIGQILKSNTTLNVKPLDGSTIYGKVLINEKGSGTVKLYDGTIIPAIFISENEVEKDKYIKFIVQSFDGDNFVLKALEDNGEPQGEKSLNTILQDLNIPFEDGRKIILNLIKYNVPATNTNLNNLFENINFLNSIKALKNSDILVFLRKHIDENITENSVEFKEAKAIFSQLKDIDLDFLSFSLENDIPQDPINLLKTQAFMKNKFFFNSFIDNIKNSMLTLNKDVKSFVSMENNSTSVLDSPAKLILSNLINNNDPAFTGLHQDVKDALMNIIEKTHLSVSNPPLLGQDQSTSGLHKAVSPRALTENTTNTILSNYIKLLDKKPSETERLIINAIINNLSKNVGIDKKNIEVKTLDEAISILKESKEMFSLTSPEAYHKLLDNFNTLKDLSNNYNMYFFNLYNGDNIFKNNIIIKNKYKGSNYIDINDVKAYITVDTKNLGKIEGNLYKKNDDISIAFNVNSEFVSLFKNNLLILKKALKEYGYNFINLTVDKINTDKNLLPFSDFFNESILKELDVKV
jgi:hypothetical protein